MKELLKKIISPYKVIHDLEKEIENQDKQYEDIQRKCQRQKNKIELLEQEKTILLEENEK